MPFYYGLNRLKQHQVHLPTLVLETMVQLSFTYSHPGNYEIMNEPIAMAD